MSTLKWTTVKLPFLKRIFSYFSSPIPSVLTSPINIRTGLPGNGKTLNTIIEIDRECSGKAPIYYYGIKDLALPGWSPLDDPLKWYELPTGSVIVIDEAQKVFPAKGMMKEVPEYLREAETLRHLGLTLHLITQDAKLITHHLRKLCNCHINYHRPFGWNSTQRTQWQRVVDPQDYFAKKEAVDSRKIPFDKKYFTAYKSAEVHTIKKTIPRKLFLIPVLLLVIFVCGYAVYQTLFNRPADPAAADLSVEGVATDVSSMIVPSSLTSSSAPPVPTVRLSSVMIDSSGVVALIERNGSTEVVEHPQCYFRILWSCDIEGKRLFLRADPSYQPIERSEPFSPSQSRFSAVDTPVASNF